MKKGAQHNAKHKPNTRHTLNELLHSLQDIMHNELAGVDPPPEPTPKAPGKKQEVLNNLKALIGSNTAPTANEKAVPAEDRGQETALADEADYRTEEPAPDPARTNDIEMSDGTIDIDPDDGVGDTTATETPSVDDFALEMEDANAPAPARANDGETKKKPRQRTGSGAGPVSTEQVEINWDDIPVLNEVVAPPPAPDDATSKQAREIAIKVAAALNIELRKEGTGTMDIKTIMRLQSLLGRELAEYGGVAAPETGEAGPEGDDATDGDA